MGALADAVRAHKVKAFDKSNTIVKETIETFGGRLVNEWTPLGDPLLWKAPPPADYKPGNLQSSWFYAPSRPSSETTEATNERHIHGLDRMPASALGIRHYLSNNAPHALAIENAHSSQAPAGILWSAMEFEPIVRTLARSQP